MPRVARAVIEGLPYHVTQRGHRRQDVFYGVNDYKRYLSWLGDYTEKHQLDILAYCLMINHIHLVVIPQLSDALANTMRIINTRHTQVINLKLGLSGHLWHGRYHSSPLDDAHLWAAVRYVERNPVRAGIVKRAEDYPWSSAAFHLGLRKDKLIRSDTMWGSPVEGWEQELNYPEDELIIQTLRTNTQSCLPCGDEDFRAKISEITGRSFERRPPGRPRK
jgi:putative transposase